MPRIKNSRARREVKKLKQIAGGVSSRKVKEALKATPKKKKIAQKKYIKFLKSLNNPATLLKAGNWTSVKAVRIKNNNLELLI